MIHIKGAKGRKDRYSLLLDIALHTLREYWRNERPRKWLFPSWNEERHITTRTVQRIFQNAYKKAGIRKDVTVHSLHHFFTTHHLKGGVDLRYIQELLGHYSRPEGCICDYVAYFHNNEGLSSPAKALKKEVLPLPGLPTITPILVL